jgi:hypothetical protein
VQQCEAPRVAVVDDLTEDVLIIVLDVKHLGCGE